jgi:hypothetical protein
VKGKFQFHYAATIAPYTTELGFKMGEMHDIKIAPSSSSLVAVPLPLAWFERARVPSLLYVSVILDEVRCIVEKAIITLVQLDKVQMKIVEGVQVRAGHFKSVSVGTRLLSMAESYVPTPIKQDLVDLSVGNVLCEPVQSLEDPPLRIVLESQHSGPTKTEFSATGIVQKGLDCMAFNIIHLLSYTNAFLCHSFLVPMVWVSRTLGWVSSLYTG